MTSTLLVDWADDNDYYLIIKVRYKLYLNNYTAYCFNSFYEVNIMTTLTHNREKDFQWTPLNLSFAVLMGVFSTAALWLLAGLLIILFL